MALPNSITTLTESLVASLSPENQTVEEANQRREAFARRLRHHNYGRTNQFDVASKLDGLQEKFIVLNNDELAAALRTRVLELKQSTYRWGPECLDLLLNLSNDPLANSKVEDLETLHVTESEQELTWADILRDDPIDKRDRIWRKVAFTGYSEDEDDSGSGQSSTPATVEDSLDDIWSPTNIPVETTAPDDDLEQSLRKAQFWIPQDESDLFNVSERQIVRESIFMLLGLPTSIYWVIEETIEIDRRCRISSLAPSTLQQIMGSFAVLGQRLNRVRRFTHKQQRDTVVQTFRQSIETCLAQFDHSMSKLEQRCLDDGDTHVLGLMAVLQYAERSSQQVQPVTNVLDEMEDRESSDAVDYLESMFTSILLLESTGASVESSMLQEIFLRSFTTYLRPLLVWLDNGRLDTDGLFIHRTDSSDMSHAWSQWYVLGEHAKAKRVPEFMQHHARSVFVTGKSAAMLGLLESASVGNRNGSFHTEFKMAEHSSLLMPFERRFHDLFADIVQPRYAALTSALHHVLDQKCGLRVFLRTLRFIYFGNSEVMDMVSNRIFDRIDRCRTDWNDQYVLSQLIKTSLQTVHPAGARSIKALAVPGFGSNMSHRRRSVSILKGFAINYNLPWHIANIITKASLVGYQRSCTFLLQIRRAIHALERRSQQQVLLLDRRQHRSYYTVRQRLLTFVKSVFDHMTAFVIEAASHDLMEALDQAEDLDAMIKAHNDFVMTLQNRMLLTKAVKPLREALITTLDLSIRFSDVTNTVSATDNDSSADAASFVSTRSRARQRKLIADNESSDEDEESDLEGYSIFVTDSSNNSVSAQMSQLMDIDREFEKQSTFVIAGLRGLARADSNPIAWEILAERLDWKEGRMG